MQIPIFELERWQSIWENAVELNISESGVKPYRLNELVGDPAELARILDVPLVYPQTNGSEELRARVAELYPGARAENVLVTCGTAEANFLATWGMLERGDEVIFLQPNYMQVSGVARACGAIVRPWWLREELAWAPDTDELRRSITPRTKLIAICNPSNPTGAVMDAQLMKEICKIASKAGAWILADEVYRGAELQGEMTATFWGQYERLICNAGFSKAYGLPGLRMGWMVAAPEKIEHFWSCKDYTTIGISMLTERLAAYALAPERRQRILARTRLILQEHYPVVRNWVERHADSLRHIPPRAGAIAWIGYDGKPNSLELAEQLRVEKRVLIVPGAQFEMEGFIRVGYGYDKKKLEQALARVDEVMFRE